VTNNNEQTDLNTETSTTLANAIALPAAGTITTTSLQLPESMSVEQWRDVVITIGQIDGAIQWWIGDWWLFGVEHQWGWGEGREAAEAAGFNYQTVKQYGSVAAAYKWCDRSHHLKFTHHLVAMSAPAKERKRWLSRAGKKGWSVAQLRAEIAEAKRIAESAHKTDDESDDDEEDSQALDSSEAPPENDQPELTPEPGGEPSNGNGVNPAEATEARKAAYAAAEAAEAATRGEAPPGPAVPPLLQAWNQASEEDREVLGNLVLDPFFRRATGTDLLNQIVNFGRKKLAEDLLVSLAGYILNNGVHELAEAFFDGLGADGMLKVMSAQFKAALRARLAPTSKPTEPKTKRAAKGAAGSGSAKAA
jgi:hypothetical protein